MTLPRRRIVVAMSGGVDSAVAAVALVQQGYEVIGISLRLCPQAWCGDAVRPEKSCCSRRDIDDARSVADRFGFPHYVLDMEEPFTASVIDYFADSYLNGETPNPCIACNTHIKFGTLWEQARRLGAEAVATGHYAGVAYDDVCDRFRLLEGADPEKDQSYVLFELTQDQLAHTVFPLSGYTKDAVRRVAARHALGVADKPESQDICFIRDNDKNRFLRDYTGVTGEPGPILDELGRQLGTHHGLLWYTTGQRRGLGISGSEPLYVLGKDIDRNALVVGPRRSLGRCALFAREVNWVAETAPVGSRRVLAKYRARSPKTPATLTVHADGRVHVVFDEPQHALTCGQAIVWYDGAVVLGGGWIDEVADAIPLTPIRHACDREPVEV